MHKCVVQNKDLDIYTEFYSEDTDTLEEDVMNFLDGNGLYIEDVEVTFLEGYSDEEMV